MGNLPMFAVRRDFDSYSDRISKSEAIFGLPQKKIASLMLIGWSTSQNCGTPQSMARMAMPLEFNVRITCGHATRPLPSPFRDTVLDELGQKAMAQ